MDLSTICAVAFFGFVVAIFAYGIGLKHGMKDAKNGHSYKNEDDEGEM